jgi:hypothetical protein
VIIDWEFAGLGAAGLDVGQFLAGCLFGTHVEPDAPHAFKERVLAAYLEGMAEVAGRAAPPEAQVRFACAAYGALRWAWLYLAWAVEGLTDADRYGFVERKYRHPMEEVGRRWAAAVHFVHDLGDEALALLPSLPNAHC